MLKNVKLQFLLVAGVSALIGYAAAHGKLNPFAKADARPADQPKPAASSAPAAGAAAPTACPRRMIAPGRTITKDARR